MKDKVTKQIKQAYKRYLCSDMYDIYDAYKTPSSRKRLAWKDCQRLRDEEGGRNLKIIGANSMVFSAGFIKDTYMFNEETSKVEPIEAFVYITKDYDRYFPVSELEG